jgi:phosphoribosylglycinamide formyltransferase-1
MRQGSARRGLGEALEEAGADLICLAGFMRVLSAEFVSRWPLRILNIHPSLLPSFPGLHAQDKAVRYGVRVSGATVHFVDAGTDSGPIVAQAAVPILPVEHALYVDAVRRVLEGGWRIAGRSVTFPGRVNSV